MISSAAITLSDALYLASSSLDKSMGLLPKASLAACLNSSDICRRLWKLCQQLSGAGSCQCGLFCKVSVCMATESNAAFVVALLGSEHYHLIILATPKAGINLRQRQSRCSNRSITTSGPGSSSLPARAAAAPAGRAKGSANGSVPLWLLAGRRQQRNIQGDVV